MTREQVLLEYAKCAKSTPYALKTYLQTYDNTVSKYVPLDLFPDQLRLVEDYESFNENIALKYRQAGVSTVTAAWASKRVAFAKKNKPEKILIIANKLDTAVEMANKIRAFIEQWPSWVGIGFSVEKNSQRHFKLTNDCEVKAVATSTDALRGYTPTILIFDEAAYIEADPDFWAACMASLSTGGKVIVISTPNGYDPIYYEIYDQALRNYNDFKISEMFWYKDPRYTKDLYFVKTQDLIHFLLNREEYSDKDIIELNDTLETRDYEKIRDYIRQGYKPCSSWFEGMVKKLKYDKRKVAQELECNFLGSGDNVFDSDLLQKISKNYLIEPSAKLMGGSLWIFKEPVNGHKYVMGIDVSRGDSEDFSCIQIIDFDEREQVLEYIGKVPPDVVAEIAYKWGNMYSAFCVVDLTGGMGVATARKLQEMTYMGGLYVDNVDTTNKWKYDPKINDKIPGINFNSKRVQIIASLEESLRHDFKIYSKRLYNEMNTYIYMNGRPDHQKGHHDDCIMAISMAIFVAEKSFQSLTKVISHTKAMINSWSTYVNENKNSSEFFNPMIPQTEMRRASYPNQGPSLEDYKKYGWLFGPR